MPGARRGWRVPVITRPLHSPGAQWGRRWFRRRPPDRA